MMLYKVSYMWVKVYVYMCVYAVTRLSVYRQ